MHKPLSDEEKRLINLAIGQGMVKKIKGYEGVDIKAPAQVRSHLIDQYDAYGFEITNGKGNKLGRSI